MDIEPSENNNVSNNQKKHISPVTKMKIMTAEKLKKESEYWIEHYKFKQNLKNQLELLKNEKPEKLEKLTKISTFSNEQDLMCDNLFKMKKITNYTKIKLGNNYNQIKLYENNEEVQKKKLKEIFENNLEKIRNIEKTSEDIAIQRELFNTWNENLGKMKNNILTSRKEKCLNIDNICNKYSQDNKEYKKISKIYNLLINITKYRVITIQKDENEPQSKIYKGYLLNAKNGNILNYNMKIKGNESMENKAMRVFNFWKTIIEFNKYPNSSSQNNN